MPSPKLTRKEYQERAARQWAAVQTAMYAAETSLWPELWRAEARMHQEIAANHYANARALARLHINQKGKP